MQFLRKFDYRLVEIPVRVPWNENYIPRARLLGRIYILP